MIEERDGVSNPTPLGRVRSSMLGAWLGLRLDRWFAGWGSKLREKSLLRENPGPNTILVRGL